MTCSTVYISQVTKSIIVNEARNIVDIGMKLIINMESFIVINGPDEVVFIAENLSCLVDEDSRTIVGIAILKGSLIDDESH
jgi:hypothetical protein